MAKIIDGKQISECIRNEISKSLKSLREKNIIPGLAVIIVEGDSASRTYVDNKKKACENLGIYSEEYSLSPQVTQEELLDLIYMLNEKPDINGILVQLPLPKHLDEKQIIEAILPLKDVDAFHAENVGKIMLGDYHLLPCTPAGIMEMLRYENIDVCGKNCVVLGRSNIVGKPMAILLLHANATVTICHTKTRNIKDICKNADIIISAVGKTKFVTADMVKKDAVVIDVGMNRDDNGKLCGDVDFENVKNVASYITPVPGGVGPMTITMLMQNTINAVKLQYETIFGEKLKI